MIGASVAFSIGSVMGKRIVKRKPLWEVRVEADFSDGTPMFQSIIRVRADDLEGLLDDDEDLFDQLPEPSEALKDKHQVCTALRFTVTRLG